MLGSLYSLSVNCSFAQQFKVIVGGSVRFLNSLYGLPVELCACFVVYIELW
jgi:hypothetical protein